MRTGEPGKGFPATSRSRVEQLRLGLPVVPAVPQVALRGAVESGRLTFASDHAQVGDADVVVLCVPTTLHDRVPDLLAVRAAAAEVARRLRPVASRPARRHQRHPASTWRRRGETGRSGTCCPRLRGKGERVPGTRHDHWCLQAWPEPIRRFPKLTNRPEKRISTAGSGLPVSPTPAVRLSLPAACRVRAPGRTPGPLVAAGPSAARAAHRVRRRSGRTPPSVLRGPRATVRPRPRRFPR